MGMQQVLYCNKCGKWIKWLNKDEIRLFEHENPPKKAVTTNADHIRSMSDEELADWIEKNIRSVIKDMEKDMNDRYDATFKFNRSVSVNDTLEWLQAERKE